MSSDRSRNWLPGAADLPGVLLVAALYWALGYAGFSLSSVSQPGTPTVAFTGGLAIAVYLIYGYRFWVGVFLGGVAAALVSGASFPAALVAASAGALGNLVGAYLMREWAGFRNSLERLRDVAALLLLGVLLARLVASGIGVANLWMAGLISVDRMPMVFLNRVIGGGIGVLIAAPFLLAFSEPRTRPLTWASALEALGILLLLSVVGTVIFSALTSPNERDALAYLLIPFVIWAAVRFEVRGAAVASVMVLGITLVAKAGGYGLFADSPRASLLLALFNTVVAAAGLIIAASIAQRRRVETELVRANDGLRDSATRIGAIVNAVVDGIITIDERGVVETLNPAAERIFGYAAAEMIGQNVKLLMPEPYHSQHDGYIERYRATGEARIIGIGREVTGRRKDGSAFPMELAVSKMQLGSERHFTGIVRDITERKQAEQALVAARDTAQLANRAKDSFLATTSHEIRTPLGGLMGMLELLGVTPLNDEQRETLHSARDSGRSLLRILDDLLDWSKIEEGKLDLSPQPTSIAALVAEVVNTYARVASSRGLVLEQQVDARLSPVLIVDPLRLSQVLNNFVSNALKFTHAGGVEVRAELLGRREGAEQVRFSVRDSGIGIEKDAQQRLFKSYGQGSAETARMYGGTGLGLAICRSLAELLDGLIEVESAPGRGSTFSITLTLPVSEAAVEDVQRAGEATDAASVPPLVHTVEQADVPIVLVVDDHPINRRLLVRQLGLLGLRAEVAENGEAALPMWRDGRFALVITDCHMPKMDGYALARAIRRTEADEARARTPIFAWTANALSDEEGNCRIAGMDELLVKPADLTQLRVVLSKWLASAATMAPGTVDATPDSSGGTAPIDLAALDKIAANAADRAEILRDFLAQTRSDLAELEAALNDLPASARLAHRMKGACRMVGARELETACEALQGAARQGSPEEARAAHAALDRAMARLEAYLAQAAGANEEKK